MNTIKVTPVAADRIKELAGEIEYLNEQYRAGNPAVTDKEYDEKVAELWQHDPTHPIFNKGIIETAPTTRKVELPVKMMSLNKLKTIEEIKAWINSINVVPDELLVLTPKYNGISLLVNPKVRKAYTRGDGAIGQDCSEHYSKMDATENYGFDRWLIGEAVIPNIAWHCEFKGKLSEDGNPYKLNNATVAGFLNRDMPSKMLKYVHYIKYGIGEKTNLSKVQQLHTIAKNCVYSVANYQEVCACDITVELLDKFYADNSLIYPIDGVVIEVNSAGIRDLIGRENNGNPGYARAIKFDHWTEEFDTVITGHLFQMSKQGNLKGVVTFEPVEINGTEVKQATFYNAKFLVDAVLIEGTKITIKKSGEVIPKIVAVEGVRIPIASEFNSTFEFNKAYGSFKMNRLSQLDDASDAIRLSEHLSVCPCCGNMLSWNDNFVELVCINRNCSDVVISKLEHFFLSIGVEEFGRPTITTLYNAGYDTWQDIISIDKETFASISGLGESTFDTFNTQISKIMGSGLPLARLLYAYDLFDGKVGEKTAQLIFDNATITDDTTFNSLTHIKGISDITAKVFLSAFKAFKNNLNLIPISYIASPVTAVLGAKNKGFQVCFSGVRDATLEASNHFILISSER